MFDTAARVTGSAGAGTGAALAARFGTGEVRPRPEGRIGGNGSVAATRLANCAPFGRIGGMGRDAT